MEMTQKRMTVGILAHVDAGKTTLAEGILYLTGEIRALGRVDHKDAFLDNFAMERDRGITIFSKQAELCCEGVQLTLVDTPGHADFSAEMERTLQILDYAVLVISGADGVQSHVETLWRLLKKYQVPTFLFINKMDQAGTDEETLLAELQKKLDEHCVQFWASRAKKEEGEETDEIFAGLDPEQKLPWRVEQLLKDPELTETLALCDEALLERYLSDGTVQLQQVRELIRNRKLFPCYFGSALKLCGIAALLEGICILGMEQTYPEAFAARVYKISRDAQGNRLTHVKITGGKLKVRDLLTNQTKGKGAETCWEEKVSQIRIYSGASFRSVNEVQAGQICALTGLNHTHSGEGLGAERDSELPVLEPVLSYRICLPDDCDVHQTYRKLLQLEEEEPELHIAWNEKKNEIYAQLMGEVQIEVLKNMIRERFGIAVEFGTGSIVYKETIAEPVIGIGHFEPLRHYAEVHLLLEPQETGSGLKFASVCSEDVLDRNWQRLILTHLEEKQHVGVLTGSEITDMKITLIAGRAHQKHTEGGDFRQATYRAVRQGLRSGRNVLLEPVYEFVIEVPQELAGRVMTDVQKMYGSVEPPELTDGTAILHGTAPVVTMRGYQTELLAYTKGRGRISCTLNGYLPCHNADEVITATDYDPEADLDNPTGSVFCAHGAGFVVDWALVPEYAHLDTAGLLGQKPETGEMQERGQIGVPQGHGSYEEMSISQEEIDEIFARTYGSAGKRERPNYRRSRRTDFDASPATPRKVATEEYLLVDGYNIIFAWEELNELAKTNVEAARTKLMDILCNYQGYKKVNLILVFDAYRVEGGQGSVQKYHNIYVVYTKEAETADQYIEKTVHAIGRKYQVTVATSDGLEQVIILGQGGHRMSARDLKEEISQMEQEIRESYLGRTNSPRNYLFNQLDEKMSALMEDVRLGKKKLE